MTHSALISDDDSSEEEEEFEPASPGGKLDESRYTAYYRNLKPKRGKVAPSAYQPRNPPFVD